MYRRRLMKGQVDDVKEWTLIGSAESDGETGAVGLCIEVDLTPYTEIFAIATMVEKGNKRRIVFGQLKAWYNGAVFSTLSESEQIYTLFARVEVIDGEIYAYGGFNSGYGGINSTNSKFVAPMFSPRETLSIDDVKYIRYDTDNNGTVPKGEILKVYAR